jgi:hypothetical protein
VGDGEDVRDSNNGGDADERLWASLEGFGVVYECVGGGSGETRAGRRKKSDFEARKRSTLSLSSTFLLFGYQEMFVRAG